MEGVHGKQEGKIRAENDTLFVEGKEIMIRGVSDPENLAGHGLGVDVVVESTGKFRDRKGASKHLEAGCKKVIITAQGKEPDVTLVPGVNDAMYDPATHSIIPPIISLCNS
jgi:glyceraldehyde 3-phosphate dehydrogenase